VTAGGLCLQLDAGNSGVKWRLLARGTAVRRGKYRPGDDASQEALLACADRVDRIWVCSVGSAEAEERLAQLLVQRWGVAPWFARSSARTGDLVNSYRDPSRMGTDRWLAMLAARDRCRDRLCVVDSGSALTIDLVDNRGRHEGGYIIPGAELMERALLLDTGRVRFAEQVDYGLAPGDSTAAAVRHGIALAQTGAVALALERAGPEAPRLMFCGGGGEQLMRLLDRGGELLPDLVFEGLALAAGLDPGEHPPSLC